MVRQEFKLGVSPQPPNLLRLHMGKRIEGPPLMVSGGSCMAEEFSREVSSDSYSNKADRYGALENRDVLTSSSCFKPEDMYFGHWLMRSTNHS